MVSYSLVSAGILNMSASEKDYKNRFNNVTLNYAIATLEDGSLLATPFWRVDSGKKGSSLLLISAQHGNEVQGVEVARQFKEICVKQLVTGSMWIVPMANLLAIRIRRHSIDLGPEQSGNFTNGHDMNLVWPGDVGGNNTERIAYALDQAVVRHCSHAVDIHCYSHCLAANVMVFEDCKPSRLMAHFTTTRFITYQRFGHLDTISFRKMSFRQLMQKRGVGVIGLEFSGQFQMKERQIQIGLKSLVNIAKHLEIIEGEPQLIEGLRAVRSHKSENTYEVYAPCSGIFMPTQRSDRKVTLTTGNYVDKNQLMGHIIRESDLKTVSIIAPVAGYLWQFSSGHPGFDASLPSQHPYTKEGNIIAIIVTV